MLKMTEAKNIAYVVLDRPDMRNAFHPELIQKLTKCFRQLSMRHDLRAVVLSGEGKVFCAGADLNWMKSMAGYSLEKNKEDSNQLFEMFEAIWNCPMPVIGAVHGAAFGGALGLIAACDYVLAEENTQMSFSEVRIGLVPAVISAFVLKKCSLGSMTPLMLSGKVFTPKEVFGAGLVHEVVPNAQMQDSLAKIIQHFHSAGPEAVRETKNLIRKVNGFSWSEACDLTCQVISERRVSAEGQEGLKSFLEKREPSWKVQ